MSRGTACRALAAVGWGLPLGTARRAPTKADAFFYSVIFCGFIILLRVSFLRASELHEYLLPKT